MGTPGAAGKVVTRETAKRVAAVLSSVKMLANDIAKMPLILRETSVTKGLLRTVPAINDPLYVILKDLPNRYQTSFEFRWFLATQLIMRGNFYAQKIENRAGLVELIPLNAWQMVQKWDRSGGPTPQRDAQGNIVPAQVFEYSDGGSVVRKFYADELWRASAHNLELSGYEGESMIALAKEAISVLIAAEETAGRNFANGLGMGGFITFPAEANVDEVQAQSVVDRLKKDYSGSQNAGKFTIIPFGGKFEKMTFNAQESQLIESRKWNEETIARLFGGAPLAVKLGYGQQNSTYASSSAFLDEYFNTALAPYCTIIEQSITRDLIPADQRAKLYAKHNADIFLRGSPKERAETNQIRINSFQMTPNEARAIEDLDAVEGGDFLTGGTGTPVIFNVDKQEFFIPGQLPPEPEPGGETPAKPEQEQEQDTEGSDQNKNAQARLKEIGIVLADRVMRKEAKSSLDAKFVAEVLNISQEKAEAFIANRKALTEQEARAALVALVTGD